MSLGDSEVARRARIAAAEARRARIPREFERAEACGVVVDVRGGDDFVGLRDFDEFEEAALDGFGGADD